jgi:pyruvate dehydrogenase E2 component (dihydrolipoamide acetyltransferase)
MAQLIKMPAVAADSATGSLAKWLKQTGDRVTVGDPIAEIETDKAIVEIAAEHAGVLARIVAQAGAAQLPVNAILGVLTAEGENDEDIERALAEGGAAPGASAPTPEGQPAAQASKDGARDEAPARTTQTESASSTRRFSSPAARRIAAECQIDLRQVDGTGPRGRILKDDVQRAVQAVTQGAAVKELLATPSVSGAASTPGGEPRHGAPHTSPDAPRDASYDSPVATRTPHSNMRRAIARRLTESKQTVPYFYLTRDCRMDALLALLREIRADGHTRISVNDFVIRAAALALIEVPEVNVGWEDDALVHHGSADIAVAVATEGGLVTPIVRHAHAKTLRQVAGEIADLASSAREHRLKPAQYTGGSMTVSNLGMYGVAQFAAIINPPQATILAVGAAEKRPVVNADGSITVATVMTVTLSVDHRAVDGAVAAKWLAAFHRLIEHPVRILL